MEYTRWASEPVARSGWLLLCEEYRRLGKHYEKRYVVKASHPLTRSRKRVATREDLSDVFGAVSVWIGSMRAENSIDDKYIRECSDDLEQLKRLTGRDFKFATGTPS